MAFASSLDQIGPFGRSVEDVSMLYSAICGKDPHDTTTVRREYPRFEDNLQADVKGLRIGIPEAYFGKGVSEEVRVKVMETAASMKRWARPSCRSRCLTPITALRLTISSPARKLPPTWPV